MTDLEAANRALTLLAVEPVGALSENVKAARVVSSLLPHCKRVVLSEFPWPFAMRTAPLVPQPGPEAGVFQYPTGALNVRRVIDLVNTSKPFRVEGPLIYCDIQWGKAEYTADVQELGAWSVQVLECLTTRLASDAASTLTGSPQMAMSLLEKYAMLAKLAMQTAAAEGCETPFQNQDYVNARR